MINIIMDQVNGTLWCETTIREVCLSFYTMLWASFLSVNEIVIKVNIYSAFKVDQTLR